MVKTGGKPRNWFHAMRCGIGFLVLFLASLLAASNPGCRAFPPRFFQDPAPALTATDKMPEATVMRSAAAGHPRRPAQHASVNFAGWRLYLHSATPAVSAYGPSHAHEPRPDAGRGIAALWPALPATNALPRLVSYRTHAPPA